MARLIVNGEGGGEMLANVGPILKVISTYMHTLRAIGIVPNWYNFTQHESFWRLTRNWSTREKAQFQAWWDGIYRCQRDKADIQSVRLLIAYVLHEKIRRGRGSAPEVSPVNYGITDAEHAGRIQEYARSKYESLDPSRGIEPNQQ